MEIICMRMMMMMMDVHVFGKHDDHGRDSCKSTGEKREEREERENREEIAFHGKSSHRRKRRNEHSTACSHMLREGREREGGGTVVKDRQKHGE